MNRPYFSPSSRRDLTEILEYIAKDKPGAAVRHLERLEQDCWLLATNPGMGTSRDDLLPNLRAWSIGNYVVYYRPAADGIEIIRVVHGSRDEKVLFE